MTGYRSRTSVSILVIYLASSPGLAVFGQFVLAAATYPTGHWTWMDPRTTVSHLGIWTAN